MFKFKLMGAVILFAMAALISLGLQSLPAVAQNAMRIFPESGGAFSSFLPEAPTYINARVLAANVAESFTVPTGAVRVIFGSNCVFYARTGGTAAVPAADVTDGTGSFPNPTGYGLRDATTISVIAPTTCIVAAAFFK